jgi:hypothetical protein
MRLNKDKTCHCQSIPHSRIRDVLLYWAALALCAVGLPTSALASIAFVQVADQNPASASTAIPTQCPEPNCPTVYGYGVGSNLLTAKNGSRADANGKVPLGCQLKHCTYKCTGPKGDAIYPSR